MFDNDLGYFDAQGLPKPHESFGDWIEEQNALPATPHREYFRKLGFVGGTFSGVAGVGITSAPLLAWRCSSAHRRRRRRR